MIYQGFRFIQQTLIITIPSQPTQLQANPFTPPQPREGGLFGGEEE
ncbi:MAG: hypothetical protein ACKPE3_32645 [Sphaerospermopsis kisseleviana]